MLKNPSNDIVLAPKPVYETTKLIFDFWACSCALMVLFPILMLIGLGILVTSGRPILYRGLRTGRYGREFFIYKFRSMQVGSDQGPGTTSKGDTRVTKIGRVMRRYKLDELPQLFNVLRGEMSLVGPRPELPQYTDRYEGRERLILSVRPGITDFSSIYFSDLSSLIDDENPDESFEQNYLGEKNRLRIKYVDERSMSTDFLLLARTLIVVFKKLCSRKR